MPNASLLFFLPSQLFWTLLPAVLAGAAIPLQAGANASLGRALGHPLWATLASLVVSLAAVVAVLLALRVAPPAPGLTGLVGLVGRGPLWMWGGGLLGAYYITAALILAPRLGAGGFIAVVVAGQMLGALLVDYYGLVGFAARALTPARLAGAALVVAGAALMQWGPGMAPVRAPSGA